YCRDQPSRTTLLSGVDDGHCRLTIVDSQLSTPTRKDPLMSQVSQAAPNTAGPLTIVIVHGAFTDASSWMGIAGRALVGHGGGGVIERLQQQGLRVIALPNPLRGVRSDSAYLASLLNQLDGPILLVAHSYGGAVIGNAAAIS